jgi:hypothetical protein
MVGPVIEKVTGMETLGQQGRGGSRPSVAFRLRLAGCSNLITTDATWQHVRIRVQLWWTPCRS